MAFQGSNGNFEKEMKMREIKKALAWSTCADLVNPPFQEVPPLVILAGDTEEVKQHKRLEHKRKLDEYEEEKIRREPEVVKEFDNLVLRIKAARPSYKEGIDYYGIAQHRKEVRVNCGRCGNKNPEFAQTDDKRGELICLGPNGEGCGFVLQEHHMDLGAARRNHEEGEDKNHHGPSPNRRMPDAWNTSTRMGATGANSAFENPDFKKIASSARQTEMDLSQIGQDERRVRDGFKSEQKQKAYKLIDDHSNRLRIHPSVVNKAEDEFSSYRDVKSALQDFEGIVAACLYLCYEEMAQKFMNVDIIDARVVQAYERPKPILVRPVADPEDIALSTCTEFPISSWNREQVVQWLDAVSGEYRREYGKAVLRHLDLLASADGSGLSKSSHAKDVDIDVIDSFFGTTTIAGREKKLKRERSGTGPIAGAAGADGVNLTHGQKLIALKFRDVPFTPDIAPSQLSDHRIKLEVAETGGGEGEESAERTAGIGGGKYQHELNKEEETSTSQTSDAASVTVGLSTKSNADSAFITDSNTASVAGSSFRSAKAISAELATFFFEAVRRRARFDKLMKEYEEQTQMSTTAAPTTNIAASAIKMPSRTSSSSSLADSKSSVSTGSTNSTKAKVGSTAEAKSDSISKFNRPAKQSSSNSTASRNGSKLSTSGSLSSAAAKVKQEEASIRGDAAAEPFTSSLFSDFEAFFGAPIETLAAATASTAAVAVKSEAKDSSLMSTNSTVSHNGNAGAIGGVGGPSAPGGMTGTQGPTGEAKKKRRRVVIE